MWKGWWLAVGERLVRTWVWSYAVLVLMCPRVLAVGSVRYENVEEQTLGLRGALAATLFTIAAKEDYPALVVEAGESRLFGIAGLKRTAVRAGARAGAWGCYASAVFLTSGVGGERVVSIEPFYRAGNTLSVSLGATLSTAELSGYEGASLVSGAIRMFARLSGHVTVGYGIDDFRLAGIQVPGAETSIYVVVSAGPRFTFFSLVRAGRDGSSGVAVAARLRWSGRLRTCVGYEDATSMLKGSLTLRFGRTGIQAGATVHPVLGVSKGLFVSWSR